MEMVHDLVNILKATELDTLKREGGFYDEENYNSIKLF